MRGRQAKAAFSIRVVVVLGLGACSSFATPGPTGPLAEHARGIQAGYGPLKCQSASVPVGPAFRGPHLVCVGSRSTRRAGFVLTKSGLVVETVTEEDAGSSGRAQYVRDSLSQEFDNLGQPRLAWCDGTDSLHGSLWQLGDRYIVVAADTARHTVVKSETLGEHYCR